MKELTNKLVKLNPDNTIVLVLEDNGDRILVEYVMCNLPLNPTQTISKNWIVEIL